MKYIIALMLAYSQVLMVCPWTRVSLPANPAIYILAQNRESFSASCLVNASIEQQNAKESDAFARSWWCWKRSMWGLPCKKGGRPPL